MTGINRVVLVGRLTADPILRKTPSNIPVASFTVAIDRRVGQGKEPAADFINCVVWNKSAENTAQYTHKGSLVGVEGRIQSRKYVDKQGNNRYTTEVVCDTVQFLEPKGSSQGRSNNTQPIEEAPSYTPDESNTPEDIPSIDISTDDLPF